MTSFVASSKLIPADAAAAAPTKKAPVDLTSAATPVVDTKASAAAVAPADDTSLANFSFADLQALGQKGKTNDKSGAEIQAEHPELFDNARLKKLQAQMDEKALSDQKIMAKIAAKEALTKRLRARTKCRTVEQRIEQKKVEQKESIMTMENMMQKLTDMPISRENLTKVAGAKQAEQYMQQIKAIRKIGKDKAKEEGGKEATVVTERQAKKSQRNAKRKAEKKAAAVSTKATVATSVGDATKTVVAPPVATASIAV